MILVRCDFLKADSIPGKNPCLIHIGDHVYMDEVFDDNVKYAKIHGYNGSFW